MKPILPPAPNRLDQIRQNAADGNMQAFTLGNEDRKMSVSVELIDEDPHNERRNFNEQSLAGLAASVRLFGIVEPPTVFEKGEGRYQIITGHRRFRAAKIAAASAENLKLDGLSKSGGAAKIDVIIRARAEDRDIRKKSIVSNIQREDVNPIELANALQALLDDNEVETQSALAETVGKDKSWVSKMLRILKLPAGLQEKVASTQLLVSYDAVAEIARLASSKQQEQLIDFLLSGASQKDVRERIKSANDGADAAQGTGSGAAGTKPKYVYRTEQEATVIIQSLGGILSQDARIRALKDALKAASQE